MLLRMLILLLILMVHTVHLRLLCGIELLTSNNMEILIKLDCDSLLEKHQKCCANHGVCYVFRKPFEVCDEEYCKCVYKIAGTAGGTCQAHGELFCNLVKTFGRNVYDLHG